MNKIPMIFRNKANSSNYLYIRTKTFGSESGLVLIKNILEKIGVNAHAVIVERTPFYKIMFASEEDLNLFKLLTNIKKSQFLEANDTNRFFELEL